MSAMTPDVGTGTSLTFEEMCDALTQRPQCRLLPEYWGQTEFLRWIAAISIGQFIDWEHHTANYSSAAFQEQLQFCALLPEQMLPVPVALLLPPVPVWSLLP